MKKLFLFIAVSLFSKAIIAQGCSDAGFCTIGTFANTQKNADELKVGSAFGVGEQSINIVTPYVQYNKNFANFQLQVKANFNSASKNNYNVTQLGDVFVLGISSFKKKGSGQLYLNYGFKFPLGNEDYNNGVALPLAYQSTLGTIDFITGLSLQVKQWNFSTALQVPLTKNNKNSFITPSSPSDLSNFVSTRMFNRKADLLIKAVKDFNVSQKINVNTGVLVIYHLGNDHFTDNAGKVNTINGSSGLTININTALNWKISDKVNFNINLGAPIAVRNVRPDGLTRSFVAIPEFIFKL